MQLDSGEMIADAERRTGLDDWGGAEFRVPLAALVRSLNEDGALSEIGERRAREFLVQRLEQRLRLFEDRKRFPEIAEQRIERPLFVTGMPRAGTTFMHGLLAADPAAISPRFWQLLSPSPPANAPGISHEDTISAMRQFLTDQGWLTPEMLRVHDFDLENPEECPFAFELSFVSTDFTGWWHIPQYAGTVLTQGFAPAYAMHRKVLQALQIGARGSRWVLKAPEHTMHLNELLETYPDALIVQHHRDPAKVIASMLSVMTVLQSRYSDIRQMGPEAGRHFVKLYAEGLAYVGTQRASPRLAGRVVDIHYRDLERDPMAQVEKIYAAAGLPLGDGAREAIGAVIGARAKGRHGTHSYALSEFGLTAEEIREAFADYLSAFKVELET